MDSRFGRYLHVLSDKPALTVKASPFYGFLFCDVTSFLHNIIASPVKTKVSNVISSSERSGGGGGGGGHKTGTKNVNKKGREIISFFSVNLSIKT
jgi:hypothetical protein